MAELPSDKFIINALQKGDVKIFKLLFDNYYNDLVKFAVRIIYKPEVAEEIVQDIFERLWLRRQEVEISHTISSYLYTSVRYRCINFLKSKIKNVVLEDDISKLDNKDENTPYDDLIFNNLTEALKASIETLPEQCQVIFKLSRNAGLSNSEIAEQLGISPKTVENQVTIALKKIREYLQKNWYVFFLFFFWGYFLIQLT